MVKDKAFYRTIGAKGGQAKVSKGFGKNRTLASISGRKGGAISNRAGEPRRWSKDIGDDVIYYTENVHGEAVSGEGIVRQVLDLEQGTAYYVLDNTTGELILSTLVA